jgi:hypothetical protein
VGVDGALIAGIAPSAVASAPLFLDVGRFGRSWLGFDARVRFVHAGTGAAGVDGGAVDLVWTTGGLDLCPVAGTAGRLRLVACARADAGVLSASGVDVVPARSDSGAWVDVGLAARGQIEVLGPLFLEVEGSLVAPITRDRFYFEPATTAFRAGVLAPSAAAGAGLAFW